MKDCKIAHRGTFDDIQEVEPDLYSGYQQALAEVTESDTDAEAELEIKREQMALQRQISKQLIEEESLRRTVSFEEGSCCLFPFFCLNFKFDVYSFNDCLFVCLFVFLSSSFFKTSTIM